MLFEDIKNAAKDLSKVVLRTPLIRARAIEEIAGRKEAPLYFKCEPLQLTRSFKYRGAYNKLLSLTDEEKACGVVTRSSGNFGQGLARAAAELGIKATVVVPENAPHVKVSSIARFKPDLRIHGATSKEADVLAFEIAEKDNKVFCSAYNDRFVVAGNGTSALEIYEDLPSIENFICPIGGGGLISGCAIALKEQKGRVNVVAVEPKGADDFTRSRAKGEVIGLEHADTLADGLRTLVVGDHNWPILQQYVDDSVTISDDELCFAMKLVYDELGMLIEPSSAVPVAAYLFRLKEISGPTVCMISGGNVDPDFISEHCLDLKVKL